MNYKTWKNIIHPIQKKITCNNPHGSGQITYRDYSLGGVCYDCYFKAGDFLKPKCKSPVHIGSGQTIRYRQSEQVQFLKKGS